MDELRELHEVAGIGECGQAEVGRAGMTDQK